jgi:hypothetical protein
MIEIAELDIRGLRDVARRMYEDIQKSYSEFGHGAWIQRTDVAATGMAAVMLQARIAGLERALSHIEEADKIMTGRVKKESR